MSRFIGSRHSLVKAFGTIAAAIVVSTAVSPAHAARHMQPVFHGAAHTAFRGPSRPVFHATARPIFRAPSRPVFQASTHPVLHGAALPAFHGPQRYATATPGARNPNGARRQPQISWGGVVNWFLGGKDRPTTGSNSGSGSGTSGYTPPSGDTSGTNSAGGETGSNSSSGSGDAGT